MRLLVRSLLLASIVVAGGATLVHGSSLGNAPCWSEPQDPNGIMIPSFEVAWMGLHSEVANDFQVDGDVITKAIWWGGFWGNTIPCQSGVVSPGFHIRFYLNAQCAPGDLVTDLDVTDFTEESVGCQGQYPLFKWTVDLSIPVVPGSTYWYSAEMMDYGMIEPSCGRLAAHTVTGCESRFKSAFFGYPDWIPCHDIVGSDWDASQEFECESETATRGMSWGAIKVIYR